MVNLDEAEFSPEARQMLKKDIEERKKIIDHFLITQNPKSIEKELNKYIIGQPLLKRRVADFVYYQVMRCKHRELPARPLLICGPSGSGKTEIWRTVKKLYGNIIRITICDATKISSEGWSGNYKISDYLNPSMNNGILVVDEFDKLAKPRFNSQGENVSVNLQSEFLKMIEHDTVVNQRNPSVQYTLRGLSTVFIGAFESIRVKKDADTAQKIGFVSQEEQQRSREITEEDLREYGVLNELLGRISAICNTNPIAEEDCLKIIHNSNSRIGTVSKVLSQYSIDPWKNLSDNSILEIIRSADIDKMGVRSVLTKIENIMMDSVYNVGLYKPQEQSPKPSL